MDKRGREKVTFSVELKLIQGVKNIRSGETCSTAWFAHSLITLFHHVHLFSELWSTVAELLIRFLLKPTENIENYCQVIPVISGDRSLTWNISWLCRIRNIAWLAEYFQRFLFYFRFTALGILILFNLSIHIRNQSTAQGWLWQLLALQWEFSGKPVSQTVQVITSTSDMGRQRRTMCTWSPGRL